MRHNHSFQFTHTTDDARFSHSIPNSAPPDANWTPHIRSASLRAEIAANPRLVQRVARLRSGVRQERSASASGNVYPKPVSPSPYNQTTLKAGASSRASAPVPAPDPACLDVETYMARPEETIRLAGLIWNAIGVSQIIAGPQLRLLSRSVSEAEISYAIHAISLAMGDAPFDSLEPQPLTHRLRRCGEQAVIAWALQLSPALRQRVLESLPADAPSPPVENRGGAVAVMQAALRGLPPKQEAEA